MNKHVLTLGILMVIIGGTYFASLPRHRGIHKPPPMVAPNETVRKLANAAFVSVTATNFEQELAAHCSILSKSNSAKWQQLDPLLVEVKRFIHCYSAMASFDDYLTFKTSGVPYEIRFDQRITNMIAQLSTNHNITFPSNSIERARLVWDTATGKDNDGRRPRITEISLQRMSLFLWKRRAPGSPIYGVAVAETGTPQGKAPTLVSFKEQPEQIQKQTGVVWYAVVGLPCKINNNPDCFEAHYLHLSFYWSEQNHRWIPEELYDDYPLKLPAGSSPFVFPDQYAYPVFF